MNAWRRFTRAYAALLNGLLVASVAILVLPVSMQIFSRFTRLIPHYIWTEEMARFLFIWMIMIGAMVGVREGAHFEVDLWPRMSARAQAIVRLFASLAILVFLVIVLVLFGANRLPELARSLGSSVKEFKKGVNEAKTEDTTSPARKEEEKKA